MMTRGEIELKIEQTLEDLYKLQKQLRGFRVGYLGKEEESYRWYGLREEFVEPSAELTEKISFSIGLVNELLDIWEPQE